MDNQEFAAILDYVLLCFLLQHHHFLYRFIISVSLIFSLLHTISLLIPYACVSTESIDCILLSSFELRAILLISSVKTVCLSLLNLCCVFKITLFFMNSFLSSLRLSTLIPFFSKWLTIFLI